MKPFLAHDLKKSSDFIKDFEGLSLTAYKCPAGILTIGYGHTGSDVYDGMEITKEKADELLLNDVRSVTNSFARLVNVPVTEGQFIALTSLAFNVGTHYVAHNCPKLMRALNVGDYRECARQFLDIVKSNGTVLNGLVRRRKAEHDLFIGDL